MFLVGGGVNGRKLMRARERGLPGFAIVFLHWRIVQSQ